jgi:hypothetical protein
MQPAIADLVILCLALLPVLVASSFMIPGHIGFNRWTNKHRCLEVAFHHLITRDRVQQITPIALYKSLNAQDVADYRISYQNIERFLTTKAKEFDASYQISEAGSITYIFK